MTRPQRSRRLVLRTALALAVLSSATACDEDRPSPTEIVTLFIGGQCRTTTSTIVCRDASRSQPARRISVVDWELINTTTGLAQGTLPSAPGGEVSFTGLTAGSYQVIQSVSATNGSSLQRTYGPFTISGSTTVF